MKQLCRSTIPGLIVSLTLPVILAAQGSGSVEIFGAMNNSFTIPQVVGGLGMSVEARSIGMRASVGAGFGSATARVTTSPAANTDIWAADVDVMFGSAGRSRLLASSFNPYAFAGIGAQSNNRQNAGGPTQDPGSPSSLRGATQNWSYGGGLLVPLGAGLLLRGEARYRTLLGQSSSGRDFVTGAEYRAALVLGFGGRRGRITDRAPGPGRSGIPASRPDSRRIPGSTASAGGAGAARRVITTGEDYLGVPYVWGGSTPRGFDCSGFVQYVYREHGVDLPRTSRQMAGAGMAVSPYQQYLVQGDLMLFADGPQISHVAIYAGNGRIIHSSSSGGGVRYDDLGTSRGRWFANHMVAARRVSADGPGFLSAFLARATIPFDHFDAPDKAPAPSRKR